jgi:2-polyprenyl-3-methyl-5-hydroxy-6-metoxy-1,4-benzoquinol methylase
MVNSNEILDAEWLEALKGDNYRNEITTWTPIYEWIIPRITGRIVADAGCGCGHFLSMLKGVRTIGIDASIVAITEAKTRCITTDFYLRDLVNSDILWTLKYDTVVFTEVLEHIKKDRKVIKSIPSGKQVFISVPRERIPSDTHVRTYKNLSFLKKYYESYLNIIEAKEVGMHHFLCLNAIMK